MKLPPPPCRRRHHLRGHGIVYERLLWSRLTPYDAVVPQENIVVISKYRARVAALDEEIQRLEVDDTGASPAPDSASAQLLSA